MTSIENEKYKGKYKGKDRDWLANFIDGEVVVDGIPAHEGKTAPKYVSVERLLALGEINGVDVSKIAVGTGNSVAGRVRMTIGNSLRARAKRRHGLLNIAGSFVQAPTEFIGDSLLVEKPDGTKIPGPVAAKAEAA